MLAGWQIAQIVSALQILFIGMVDSDLGSDYDWDSRLLMSRDLEIDHPALARDLPLREVIPAVYIIRGGDRDNEMLGHSDVHTTMIYTHTVKSRMQKSEKKFQ